MRRRSLLGFKAPAYVVSRGWRLVAKDGIT